MKARAKSSFLSETASCVLGFDAVWARILPVTPYGKIIKHQQVPFLSHAQAELEQTLDALEQTLAFYQDQAENRRAVIAIFEEIKGLTHTFDRIEAGEVLSVTELFEIKRQAMQMRDVAHLLRLCKAHDGFWDIQPVIAALDPENTGLPTFYIYSAYSETLSKIRAELDACESQIMGLRMKRQSSDASLSEKRERLLTEEQSEELDVRCRLSKVLRSNISPLRHNAGVIGTVDFLLAKASYAVSERAVRPQFSSKGFLVENAHFPALRDKLGAAYTPIDIDLTETVTVITGANMGGKTVALKTIGLIAAMARYGLFVPCTRAKIEPIDYIFAAIGDGQSTDLGLSTFGAEIAGIAAICKEKMRPGLILLDEFGRGTNPREGTAISQAILENLMGGRARVVATTHDENLTRLAGVGHYQTGGLASVDDAALEATIEAILKAGLSEISKGIDQLKKYMDYRLYPAPPDAPIPQEALRITTYLGLDSEIVLRAKALLGGTHDA